MQNNPDPVPPPASERWSMGCAAVIFGLLTFWIGWIVANFLDGHGWSWWPRRFLLSAWHRANSANIEHANVITAKIRFHGTRS